MKTKALKLAEMNDFLHKREEEDAKCQHEIQETYKNLSKWEYIRLEKLVMI